MRPLAMIVQPDGKIIVAGHLTDSADVYGERFFGRTPVVRFLPDGEERPSASANGKTPPERGFSMRLRGFEPPRALAHGHLKAARIPGFATAARARSLACGQVFNPTLRSINATLSRR
jgi:hypothetical protein